MLRRSVLVPSDYMASVAVGYIAAAVNTWIHEVVPGPLGTPAWGILTGAFLLMIALLIKKRSSSNETGSEKATG